MSTNRKKVYNTNKIAKVGEEIICPICGCKFVKKQYSQAFCSGECKDKFWNDKKRGKRNAYFREYNRQHPERIERVRPYDYDEYCHLCYTYEHPFSSDALGQD